MRGDVLGIARIGVNDLRTVRYSIFTLVRNAIAYHARWPQAWRRPQPKRSYDVAIVGGGGASALAGR